MKFSNKKTTDFESKFKDGYNRGFELNTKIPLQKSKETQEVLYAMRDSKPKDIILLGICSGFTDALHFERIQRLSQIDALEKTQTKSNTKER
jgi:hypothetical protein